MSLYPEETYMILPDNLDFVPALRGLISEITGLRGFDARDRFRIETIVDEMCNNAIEHGYKNKDIKKLRYKVGSRDIIFICILYEDRVELIVRDKGGNEKNVLRIRNLLGGKKRENEDPTRKRGRGLDLIKMLSDDVSVYITDNGETELRVIKYKKEE